MLAADVVVVGATVVVVDETVVLAPLFVFEEPPLLVVVLLAPVAEDPFPVPLRVVSTGRDAVSEAFSLEAVPGISIATAVPIAAVLTVAATTMAAVRSLKRRLTVANAGVAGLFRLLLSPACGARGWSGMRKASPACLRDDLGGPARRLGTWLAVGP